MKVKLKDKREWQKAAQEFANELYGLADELTYEAQKNYVNGDELVDKIFNIVEFLRDDYLTQYQVQVIRGTELKAS